MWHKNILAVGDCVLVQAHPNVTYDQKIAIEDELDIHNINSRFGNGIVEINFGERTAFQFDIHKRICTWFSKSENQIVEVETSMRDGLVRSGLGMETKVEDGNLRNNFVVLVAWRGR